eukprot:1158000-Pelagomonas_calceolata.AAC.1
MQRLLQCRASCAVPSPERTSAQADEYLEVQHLHLFCGPVWSFALHTLPVSAPPRLHHLETVSRGASVTSRGSVSVMTPVELRQYRAEKQRSCGGLGGMRGLKRHEGPVRWRGWKVIPGLHLLQGQGKGGCNGRRWEEGMADVWKLLDELDKEADFRSMGVVDAWEFLLACIWQKHGRGRCMGIPVGLWRGRCLEESRDKGYTAVLAYKGSSVEATKVPVTKPAVAEE